MLVYELQLLSDPQVTLKTLKYLKVMILLTMKQTQRSQLAGFVSWFFCLLHLCIQKNYLPYLGFLFLTVLTSRQPAETPRTAPSPSASFSVSFLLFCSYRICVFTQARSCLEKRPISHILVILNNIAMIVEVFTFFRISVLGPLGYVPGSGIVWSKGRSIFNFFEVSPCCFPQWLHQSAFPPTVQKGSPFSTSSPALFV